MGSPAVGFIGKVIGRKAYRTHPEHFPVQVTSAGNRPNVVVERSVNPNNRLGGRGQVNIHVGTDQVFFQINVIVEIIAFIDIQNAVILRKRTGNIVAGHFPSTGNIQVGPLINGNVFGEQVHPVGGGIDVGVQSLDGIVNLGIGVRGGRQGI